MRYMLFGSFEMYYAQGGAWDYLDSGNNVEALKEVVGNYSAPELDWWHIWDTLERKIVGGSKYQAHGAPDVTEV